MTVYVALLIAGTDSEIRGVYYDPDLALAVANAAARDHFEDAVGVVQPWEITK